MTRIVTPYYLFSLLLSFAMERGVFVLFLGEMGFTSSQVSILQIVFFLSCFVAEIPTGMISDAFGRKTALALGSLSMGLAVFLQFQFRHSFWLMLISFILHATAFAFVSGAVTALLYDELRKIGRPDKYAFQLSAYNFLQSVGLGIAMLIGGIVQSSYSWEGLYYCSAIMQGLSIVPVFFMTEHKHDKDHQDGFFQSFFHGASDLFPIILPISLVHAAMTPYFVFSQKLFKSFELSITWISSIMATVEFVAALAALAFTLVTARFFKSGLLAMLVLFTSMLGLHVFISPTDAWLFASVAMILVSNTIVLYIIVISDSYYQSRITDHSKRSSIMSFAAFVDTAFIGVGYIFYGFFLDHFEIQYVVAGSALFPLLSILMIAYGRKYAKI